MEFVSLNPLTYPGDHFHAFIQVILWFMMGVIDRQQAPPHLTFASP
jgi:hypothetical protein